MVSSEDNSRSTRDIAVRALAHAESTEKALDKVIADINADNANIWSALNGFKKDTLSRFFWLTCLFISTLVSVVIQLALALIQHLNGVVPHGI